ncbi:MAG: hypothetical protein PVH61_13140 [Candidatus Aminicenantes bacterium]|jgi:hypothetical protein
MKMIATKARRLQGFIFDKTFCLTLCLCVLVAIFMVGENNENNENNVVFCSCSYFKQKKLSSQMFSVSIVLNERQNCADNVGTIQFTCVGLEPTG